MIGLVLALALMQPVADADRLFDLGLRLVAEGDTAGAVAAWEGAAAAGWTSAAVEHNLGTVALARGDAARARLHLERAARLAPLDNAVARNLGLARERAGEPPPSAARRAWARAVGVLTPFGVVALALAVSFGALGLAVAGRRRWAAGVGVLALVAVAGAVVAVSEATRPLGIVMADDAPVVEAPSPTAPGVARLRAGEAVEVGAPVDGWRPVTVGRAEGWVRADAVEPI
ncbi:SH3 domain-containing protein [Rubrivirga sp.]|uniref:SH3 domain-containing protein n=1 Tax=Rubrivirga sp. TaxID=1885344 RepID=UPI003B52450A